MSTRFETRALNRAGLFSFTLLAAHSNSNCPFNASHCARGDALFTVAVTALAFELLGISVHELNRRMEEPSDLEAVPAQDRIS